MCFGIIPLAIVSSLVAQKMSMDAQNDAAVHSYNEQVKYAETVNQSAIRQQSETDSRNRVEMLRNAESAADKTRAAILDNRRAMATARASAGTSGLMGLPLNILEQNYQSLIGGQATNLTSYNQQLNENYFFNSIDTAARANSISNQAVPQKPYLQKFGAMNWLTAGLAGANALTSMLTAGTGTPAQASPNFGTFNSAGANTSNGFDPNMYNSVQSNGNVTVYSTL